MTELWAFVYDASAWVIPVFLAITLHEAAHGFAAWMFGDDTARRAGRLTLNPLKHIDRFGTLILPALLLLIKSPVIFGYAKPVPVQFARLSPPRLGGVIVALAGVFVNALLAYGAALGLHLEVWVTPEQAPWLYMNLYRAIIINAVLIIFNLLPILPLDGGRVVQLLLPQPLARGYAKLERIGIFIIFGLLLLPLAINANPLGELIANGTGKIVEVMIHLAGHGSF